MLGRQTHGAKERALNKESTVRLPLVGKTPQSGRVSWLALGVDLWPGLSTESSPHEALGVPTALHPGFSPLQ